MESKSTFKQISYDFYMEIHQVQKSGNTKTVTKSPYP